MRPVLGAPETLVQGAERRLASYRAPAEAAATAPTLELTLDSEQPEQGYELTVTEGDVRLRAADAAGFRHGAVTLAHWIDLHRSPADAGGAPLESTSATEPLAVGRVEIRDRPDFAERGLLLDVSRNKVPTLETLFRLVEVLADLKYNQLQLYMEHTFAYREHETVWRDADPLTGDEIRRLDAFCRSHGIELVPNQNSFGHLHRWLRHERYRHLAECPDGIEHPFSNAIEPFSLCPTDPAAVEFMAALYEELLPNFSSRRLHAGFDETFEIGRGRSRERCQREGLGTVWTNFLNQIRGLARRHGRSLQIWADMPLKHRDILESLAPDVTLCLWGYEDGHPFEDEAATLAELPNPLYVCPGTSTWLSLAGRTGNALANLEQAAQAGSAAGATGYLLTEWGDRGHLQTLSSSYPALVAAAGQAWNGAHAGGAERPDWAAAVDRYVLGQAGSGLGSLLLELGDLYRETGATQKNGTALFHLLGSPGDGLDHPRYRGMTSDGLERAAVRALELAAAAAPGDGSSEDEQGPNEINQTRAEIGWTADAVALAATMGRMRLEAPTAAIPALPEGPRSELAERARALASRRRVLWLERNRPGGLADSLETFERLASLLEPGS